MANKQDNKKRGLTREEANELYRDLQKAVGTLRDKGKPAPASGKQSTSSAAKQIADAIRSGLKSEDSKGRNNRAPEVQTAALQPSDFTKAAGTRPVYMPNGKALAITCVLAAAAFKFGVSLLEVSGVLSVSPAHAALAKAASTVPGEKFTREDLNVLTQLEQRRLELEKRNERLDQREGELKLIEREQTTKIAELRELTELLKIERDKGDKKRNAQLEQLANVYGSMNPTEAAQLLEQLDIAIALSLMERMPEKRIGQILALMKPDRALAITKMLSKRS